MAVTDAIQAHLARQVPQVYLWCAVGFATGAGLYFGLPYEPGFWSLPVLCVLSFLLLTRRAPLLTVVACLGLGYGWAGIKAHWVAGPVLDKRMYTTVTGRVVLLDKSASDKPRMTLDQVQIEKLAGRAGPHRVRIALHGPGAPPDIGDRLRIVAHLSPPPGPAEPHGFDFQRHAWFLRLGAVGYARKPPVDVGQGGGVPMAQMRARVTDWVHTHLPQRTGGVAVAITTGDRSYLTTDVVQDLRAANLAHLLAISGLHMGLLAGLMFGVLRFAFLPLPRGDPKRWAAAGALALAFGYLLLSGASIATERAFVMTAVVFGAVILRRRALTLRAVALAVWIVLVLRPQAIISPGFHMSFAATIALIVAFRWITDHGYLSRPGPLRYLGSATVSALVAGAATAPFAAAHFNMIPHYGLVANLLAVPLMASVVMPGWIIAVILTPVGAEGLGFWIMDHGLQAILWIAHQVAGWAGAVSRVKSPAPVVLPAMTLGAIFFILWQGHIRWAGIGAVALAIILWGQTPRPDVLIADSGLLVGVMGPQGRHLSRDKGAGFAARVWLENDGENTPQAVAASRPPPYRRWVRALRRLEAGTDICGAEPVVIPEWLDAPDCPVFDLRRLRRTGSVAGYIHGNDLRWVTAKGATGRRLWNDRWMRRDEMALHPWRGAQFVLP